MTVYNILSELLSAPLKGFDIIGLVKGNLLVLAIVCLAFGAASVFSGEKLFSWAVRIGGGAFGAFIGICLTPVFNLEDTAGAIALPVICGLFIFWIASAVYYAAIITAVVIPAYYLASPIIIGVFAENELMGVSLSYFAALLCGVGVAWLTHSLRNVMTSLIGGTLMGCGITVVFLEYGILSDNLLILDCIIVGCAVFFGVIGSIIKYAGPARAKKKAAKNAEKNQAAEEPNPSEADRVSESTVSAEQASAGQNSGNDRAEQPPQSAQAAENGGDGAVNPGFAEASNTGADGASNGDSAEITELNGNADNGVAPDGENAE